LFAAFAAFAAGLFAAGFVEEFGAKFVEGLFVAVFVEKFAAEFADAGAEKGDAKIVPVGEAPVEEVVGVADAGVAMAEAWEGVEKATPVEEVPVEETPVEEVPGKGAAVVDVEGAEKEDPAKSVAEEVVEGFAEEVADPDGS
jgi:hypothetical protein